MHDNESALTAALTAHGFSRRDLLKYCAGLAALLALPVDAAEEMVRAISQKRRPAVIWLSFQECTGCTESITRSHAPTLENLILDLISLEYHHTLQAACGLYAEEGRLRAMRENEGKYLLVVDGSIPLGNPGYSTIAGVSNRAMLEESAKGAAALIALGSCAVYGGLPAAAPNPTGAVPVNQLIKNRPVLNLPGCPPIPAVITATLLHFLTFGRLPDTDFQGRPQAFYGETIHDRCYRRPFYDRGLFADTFDDKGAQQGWCLYKLGCKGPTTYNACATLKWNDGVSFPIQSGHGCLGCSESSFWDAGGFYHALSETTAPLETTLEAGLAVGVGAGALAAMHYRQVQKKARTESESATLDDLKKP